MRHRGLLLRSKSVRAEIAAPELVCASRKNWRGDSVDHPRLGQIAGQQSGHLQALGSQARHDGLSCCDKVRRDHRDPARHRQNKGCELGLRHRIK